MKLELNCVIWSVIRKFGAGPVLLRVHPKSALVRLGWFRSFRTRSSVDQSGNPLPWWTYGAIEFVAHRLRSSMRVLEFGCGNSTVWLSERVKEVVSIETNAEWASRISQRLASNARIIVASPPWASTSAAICGKGTDEAVFDLVIIDADADRMRCFDHAVQYLADSAIVLWDNTDGPDWDQIRLRLAQFGYRQLSFTGMVPQELCLSRTTIFYRQDNCFGI